MLGAFGNMGRKRKCNLSQVLKTKGAKGEPSSLTMYLKEIANEKHLKNEEKDKLIKKYRRTGNEKARERVIKSDLQYVVHVAVKYKGLVMELEDVIQEGNVGLLIALERYKFGMGANFLTFATWWIKQRIIYALYNTAETIRIPVYLKKRLLENDPEVEYLRNLYHISSIDKIIDSKEEAFGDGIRIEPADYTMYEILDRILLKGVIEECMKKRLNEREKRIINMYYGLNGEMKRGYRQIAAVEGITHQRVQQINVAALHKLKVVMKEEKLKEELVHKPSKLKKELLGRIMKGELM